MQNIKANSLTALMIKIEEENLPEIKKIINSRGFNLNN